MVLGSWDVISGRGSASKEHREEATWFCVPPPHLRNALCSIFPGRPANGKRQAASHAREAFHRNAHLTTVSSFCLEAPGRNYSPSQFSVPSLSWHVLSFLFGFWGSIYGIPIYSYIYIYIWQIYDIVSWSRFVALRLRRLAQVTATEPALAAFRAGTSQGPEELFAGGAFLCWTRKKP